MPKRPDNIGRRKLRAMLMKTAGEMGQGSIAAPSLVERTYTANKDEIRRDDELFSYVTRKALSADGRSLISRVVGEFEDDDAHQMELFRWPDDEQRMAAMLGVMRAFFPSQNKHMALFDPNEIKIAEVEEAADYLIGHGRGCIRKGNLLHKIARHRRAKSEQSEPRPDRRPDTDQPGVPA